jgi:baculoviral IAP repeat-containing protein 7/8
LRITFSEIDRFEERRASFRDWPSHVSSFDLSRAGFYYSGESDRVKCAFCQLRVQNWSTCSEPMTVHRRMSPTCPFILNPPSFAFETERISNALSCTETRLNIFPPPTHGNRSTYHDRLLTFRGGWTEDAKVKPEDLSEAGFFWTGHKDRVRCFHCNGTLSNWVEGDKAWEEHGIWHGHCAFVRLNKGENFIESCRLDLETHLHRITENISTDAILLPQQQIDLDLAMKSCEVKILLSRRVPLESLRKIIYKHVKENGSVSSKDLRRVLGSAMNFKKTIHDPVVSREITPENLSCKICMNDVKSISFLPCGHFVACNSCGSSLKECPICRKNILGVVRVFES